MLSNMDLYDLTQLWKFWWYYVICTCGLILYIVYAVIRTVSQWSSYWVSQLCTVSYTVSLLSTVLALVVSIQCIDLFFKDAIIYHYLYGVNVKSYCEERYNYLHMYTGKGVSGEKYVHKSNCTLRVPDLRTIVVFFSGAFWTVNHDSNICLLIQICNWVAWTLWWSTHCGYIGV